MQMRPLRMTRDLRFLPRRQVGVEVFQRLRRLVLDARNLLADVAAAGSERAQFIDLGIELGDGLFKIEITAHVIRHRHYMGPQLAGETGLAGFSSQMNSQVKRRGQDKP